MKKNLILTVVMFVVLAIGIGVGRVFSQVEDVKADSNPHHEEAKTHAKSVEPHMTKTETAKVESSEKPDQVAQTPAVESPVSQISVTQPAPVRSKGKGFSSLLYPERKELQVNSITEDGIFGLYTELQSEAQGSNASAIEQHAELRSALMKYVESRKALKTEATVLNSTDKAQQ